MPFKKQPNGTYKSPTGRIFTLDQVKAYYASKAKKKSPNKSKY